MKPGLLEVIEDSLDLPVSSEEEPVTPDKGARLKAIMGYSLATEADNAELDRETMLKVLGATFVVGAASGQMVASTMRSLAGWLMVKIKGLPKDQEVQTEPTDDVTGDITITDGGRTWHRLHWFLGMNRGNSQTKRSRRQPCKICAGGSTAEPGLATG